MGNVHSILQKLRQIEQLKQQQADGGTLELNQVWCTYQILRVLHHQHYCLSIQLEKIKTEDSILAEIEKLELDSK